MMNRTTMIWMLLAAVVAASGLANTVRADGSADLQAALEELKKSPDQQDASLIDAKLASAVEALGDLRVYQFRQARMLQEQRRVAGLADKTAPEKRQALNDAYVAIAEQIGNYYLPNVAMDPRERFDTYRQQLDLARQISLSTQAEAMAKGITTAMLADLDSRYIANEENTPAQKLEAIRQACRSTYIIRDQSLRDEFEKALYTRMIALGTPEGKAARIDRAKLLAAAGDLTAAKNDFEALIQDAEIPGDIKSLARFERMSVLVNQKLWADALADADVLNALTLADASADSEFGPAMVAGAKRQAIRVKFANSQLTAEQVTQAVDSLWQEVLNSTILSADEKSEFLASVALDRARELGAKQQWQPALSWAKAAYIIAPNRRVNESVTLMQQLLANRSRTSFVTGSTVAKNPADLAAAEAFYLRQKGVKDVPNAEGTASETISLKADLSTDAQFPRQLDSVSTPLSGDIKTAIEQVAANHTDLQTRALAQGLLCNADNAITAVAQAIDALDIESGQTSGLVNYMARFVRGKFESVALANAFLENQANGPAGPDGELGTEDDTPNPLTASQE